LVDKNIQNQTVTVHYLENKIQVVI